MKASLILIAAGWFALPVLAGEAPTLDNWDWTREPVKAWSPVPGATQYETDYNACMALAYEYKHEANRIVRAARTPRGLSPEVRRLPPSLKCSGIVDIQVGRCLYARGYMDAPVRPCLL